MVKIIADTTAGLPAKFIAGHLCVMHADAEMEAKVLAAEFQAGLGIADVPVFEVPPAIVVHAGPGALAVGFFVSEQS